MLDAFLKALATKPPDYQAAVLAALGDGTTAHKRSVSMLVEAAHVDALVESVVESVLEEMVNAALRI